MPAVYKQHYFFIILVLFLVACEMPSDDSSGNQQQPDTPGSDNKTYLKIVNNTGYAVNVYINDPPIYQNVPDTIRQIPAQGSNQWELQPTSADKNGETLYFEYLIPFGNVTVPYYANNTANVKIKKLEAGQVNTQEVPPLVDVSTNSIFVLIRNDSSDSIWMEQGIYIKKPYGSTGNEIPGGSGAVFVFDQNVTSLSNITIGDLTRKNFPATPLQPGRVYSFIYTSQANPSLYLVEHFNPNTAKNIWTIPTTRETGIYFSMGLLAPRANINDGYIVTGRSNYSLAMITQPTVGSVSYLGMLAPDGSLSVEKKITLNNAPASLNIRGFIENSGGLVFSGQAYDEDADGFPFILNTDLNGVPSVFYADFINDIDPETQALYGDCVVKNNTGYALGAELFDYNRNMSQIYIASISQASWDTAQHTKLWTSPETDDTYFLDLKYDAAQQTYIVLAGDYQPASGLLGSYLYFVGADGVQKTRVRLDRYEITTIFTVNNEFYVAGTYEGATGYRGIINKLDVNAGTFGSSPWLVDSKYANGKAVINNMVLDSDGTMVFGGWCAEAGGEAKPWLIKYDLTASRKIWEIVYDDYPGAYIYSVHHNAIGSYLVEIYNDTTYESFLVSTDLMGKAGGNRLAAIPRNASAFTAAAPGQPRISAELIPVTDADLATEALLTIPKGQSATVSATGSWNTYQWYVNGTPVSGAASSSFIFNSNTYSTGIYTVTLVVTDSKGEKRSASCRVTVTN
ncbi:MAG: hypothetical protein LBQ14_08960 [Treponema sp.]|jgi:hypothetical protein|nr:hypothetical protein [Treponema sp.]